MKQQRLKLTLLQTAVTVYVLFSLYSTFSAFVGLNQHISIKEWIPTGFIYSVISELIYNVVLATIAILSFFIIQHIKDEEVFVQKNIQLFNWLAYITYFNALQLFLLQLTMISISFNSLEFAPHQYLQFIANNRAIVFLSLGIMFHVLSAIFQSAKLYKHEVDLTV